MSEQIPNPFEGLEPPSPAVAAAELAEDHEHETQLQALLQHLRCEPSPPIAPATEALLRQLLGRASP